jgi:glycosyltransferase involved in cell wall biosynthesis
MQRDVRPYLWAADAFAFPSAYETFSLVAFEAGAAGLPLLVTHLHGVSETLSDGENGFVLERTRAGVERGLRRLMALPPEQRRIMGERARARVEAYSVPKFVANWRTVYEESFRQNRPVRNASEPPFLPRRGVIC